MFNRFIAIDFETANQERNSACALGIVVVENGVITDQAHFLIKPPSSFFCFTHIHGLTWNDVKEAESFEELWPSMRRFFRKIDFVAAHNSSFDRGVLRACCDHYGQPFTRKPFVCSKELAKRELKLESSALNCVSRHLGIDLNHHNALSDATACAKIIIALGGAAC